MGGNELLLPRAQSQMATSGGGGGDSSSRSSIRRVPCLVHLAAIVCARLAIDDKLLRLCVAYLECVLVGDADLGLALLTVHALDVDKVAVGVLVEATTTSGRLLLLLFLLLLLLCVVELVHERLGVEALGAYVTAESADEVVRAVEVAARVLNGQQARIERRRVVVHDWEAFGARHASEALDVVDALMVLDCRELVDERIDRSLACTARKHRLLLLVVFVRGHSRRVCDLVWWLLFVCGCNENEFVRMM